MTKFTTQLRRLDDAELDPYQFRVLVHVWRVGECWESRRTMAKKLGISIGKTQQTVTWLLENGWLERCVTRHGRAAIRLYHHMNAVSPHERAVSPHEQAETAITPKTVSPHELKINGPNEVVNKNDDPTLSLADFFTQQTGLLPNRSNYAENWERPLQLILDNAGSMEKAQEAIEGAVKFARNGNGKRYTVASPKSIANIAANLIADNKTGGLVINAV